MTRLLISIIAAITIVGAIVYLEGLKSAPAAPQQNPAIIIPEPSPSSSAAGQVTPTAKPRPSTSSVIGEFPPAKEIASPAGFINSSPFTISQLIGKKVILVDFWTYSCINCQRTTPYLNAWYEKYKDKGLEIIGVHTPEFEFEKKYENVVAAVQKFNIKYPVVLDNNYATWSAYNNSYWPRKYLININGAIVYNHIGEGAYEETEQKIREALAERAVALGLPAALGDDMARPIGVIQTNSSQVGTPETYFGAFRNETLANGQTGQTGAQTLTEPAAVERNRLYLSGNWYFDREFAQNQAAAAKIIIRYQAKNVYLVAAADQPVRVKILRDGKLVTTEAGGDVAGDGTVTIKDDRLYKIIEDKTGYGEHVLELIIETPGLKAFTFTFG